MIKKFFCLVCFASFLFAVDLKKEFQLLESTSPVVRRNAVARLSRVRNKDVILKLKELLQNDPDFGVRAQAAEALGNLRDRSATSALIKALGDENRNVRATAIVALGYLRDKASVKPLTDYYKTEKDVGLKISVLNVLGVIGDISAADVLIEALSEKNPRIKTIAASSLGRLRVRKASEKLVECLKDADRNVRLYSARALGEIGNKDKKVIKALVKYLESEKDLEVKVAIADALGKLGSEEGFEIALKAAKDRNVNIKRAGLRALTSIGKSNDDVKSVVIEAWKSSDSRIKRDAEMAASYLKIKLPKPEKEKKIKK